MLVVSSAEIGWCREGVNHRFDEDKRKSILLLRLENEKAEGRDVLGHFPVLYLLNLVAQALCRDLSPQNASINGSEWRSPFYYIMYQYTRVVSIFLLTNTTMIHIETFGECRVPRIKTTPSFLPLLSHFFYRTFDSNITRCISFYRKS